MDSKKFWWLVCVLAVFMLLTTLAAPLREPYQIGTSDAALVCYWAPQPPPGAIPTQRDPAGIAPKQTTVFTNPIGTPAPERLQERLTPKPTFVFANPAVEPTPLIDRKAYVDVTQAPMPTIGTLPVPPMPTVTPTPPTVSSSVTTTPPTPTLAPSSVM